MSRWAGALVPPLVALAVCAALAGCAGTAGTGATSAQERPGSTRANSGDSGDSADQAAGRPTSAPNLPPCPSSRPAARARPDGLPALTLDCLGAGPQVRLSDLRGAPTVVNVWASWCPPCAAETPILERVRQETDGELRFLGIDLLDKPAAGADAAAAFGMGFPSVSDPDGRTRAALDVPGPPVTLFVDAQGRVVHRHVGQITDAAQLRGLVSEHLGVRA